MEGMKEGGKEEEREGGREGRREGGREGGKETEGGREKAFFLVQKELYNSYRHGS